MKTYLPTIVWRHRKEKLKKCSLHGLEIREDLRFFRYPVDPLPDLEDYVLLSPRGSPLNAGDENKGLLLLDGTWRLAQKMEGQLPAMEKRCLPFVETAYPRRQDQQGGLASVEALYLAYVVLRRDPSGLLDGYLWRDAFIENTLRGLSHSL